MRAGRRTRARDADPRPSRGVISLMPALPAGRPEDAVRERQRTGVRMGEDRFVSHRPTQLVPPDPRIGKDRFVRRGGTVKPYFVYGEPSGQPDPSLRTRGLVRKMFVGEAGRRSHTLCMVSRPNDAYGHLTYQDAFLTPGIWPL